MGYTDEMRKALKGAGAITPKYAPLDFCCAISGLGRTRTYELLGDGTLRAIKCGKRLLVDVEFGLGALAAMPAAQIRRSPPRKQAAAEQTAA